MVGVVSLGVCSIFLKAIGDLKAVCMLSGEDCLDRLGLILYVSNSNSRFLSALLVMYSFGRFSIIWFWHFLIIFWGIYFLSQSLENMVLFFCSLYNREQMYGGSGEKNAMRTEDSDWYGFGCNILR